MLLNYQKVIILTLAQDIKRTIVKNNFPKMINKIEYDNHLVLRLLIQILITKVLLIKLNNFKILQIKKKNYLTDQIVKQL